MSELSTDAWIRYGMSDDVRSVLIVPSKGDPLQLLGDPQSPSWRRGARFPTVVWDTHRRETCTLMDSGSHSSTREVLVIAIDGEPDPVGCLSMAMSCHSRGQASLSKALDAVIAAIEEVVWESASGRLEALIDCHFPDQTIVFLDEHDKVLPGAST